MYHDYIVNLSGLDQAFDGTKIKFLVAELSLNLPKFTVHWNAFVLAASWLLLLAWDIFYPSIKKYFCRRHLLIHQQLVEIFSRLLHLRGEIFLNDLAQIWWNAIRLGIEHELPLFDALERILVFKFYILDLIMTILDLVDETLIIILEAIDLFLLIVIQIYQLLSSWQRNLVSVVNL